MTTSSTFFLIMAGLFLLMAMVSTMINDMHDPLSVLRVSVCLILSVLLVIAAGVWRS